MRAQRRDGTNATINNGLILPGNTAGGFGYSGYVSLPNGILTNTTSITVECWVTQNQGKYVGGALGLRQQRQIKTSR